jgi:hypothetical protein
MLTHKTMATRHTHRTRPALIPWSTDNTIMAEKTQGFSSLAKIKQNHADRPTLTLET